MPRLCGCLPVPVLIEAVDTPCINTTVTGDGSLATPYVVSSVPIIDPDPGNALTCGALGLLATSSSHSHDDPVGGSTSLVVGGDNESGPTVPTATAPWSIAMGDFAEASDDAAIAIGSSDAFVNRTRATSEAAIAIGSGGVIGLGARATGIASIAIGSAVALLPGALASSDVSIAIGVGASATVGTGNIAIGEGATCSSSSAGVAVGHLASSTGFESVAIGASSVSSGSRSIAVRGTATATDAFTLNGTASSIGAIAIGAFSQATTGDRCIAIGGGVNTTAAPFASGQGAIAVGASDGVAILGPRASAESAIAIGSGTAAAIGASATAASAIAIGRTSSAAHANAVALGDGVATTATSQVNIGIKRAFVGCPTTAPAGADLINSQISFSTDEAANTFIFTVKDSAGTVQTGTVVLV